MIAEGSARWAGALLTVLLGRGLVVFAAAWAVTALAKGLSSETRHLIWLGVIGGFAVIPLAWLALPALQVGSWIPPESSAAYTIAMAPVLSHEEYLRLAEQVREQALLSRLPQPKILQGVAPALMAAWAAGAAALAGRLLLGRRTLRRLAARARESAELRDLAGKLAGELAVHRVPAVLLSDRCAVPFTFGIRRPVIVLPVSAPGWPRVRIDAALTHELAHVRRRDVLTQSMAYCVCLVFWFIPPVWLAYAAMLREAETCCDQQVINQGIRGPVYARDIVSLARGSHGRILLPCMSGAVGGRSMLKKRVMSVLRLRPGAAVLGSRGRAGVLLVFLCCLVPLLALTCATRPPALGADDPLFGTWVNEEIDKGQRSLAAKVVMFPGGRELDYRHIADTEPSWEASFVVEEAWVDAEGYRWYKMRSAFWAYPSGAGKVSGYSIVRIDPAGTTIESNWAQYGFPEQFGPLGPGYGMAYNLQ